LATHPAVEEDTVLKMLVKEDRYRRTTRGHYLKRIRLRAPRLAPAQRLAISAAAPLIFLIQTLATEMGQTRISILATPNAL
jgi:hypothetical protein